MPTHRPENRFEQPLLTDIGITTTSAYSCLCRRRHNHDLRHSFGTMAVRRFPITDVQTWMGHADIATTRKYIHYAPQPEAAARLGSLVAEQLGVVSSLRQAG
jgi:integrase